jgi:predicted ATPase
MLTLREFVIENFRSIVRTEPVALDRTCVIVGVNEAGKSNSLLALCRTNPANPELKIRTKDDVPRTLFNEFEAAKFKKPFCYATYQGDTELLARIQALYPYGRVSFTLVKVTSYFDGSHDIEVPDWAVTSIDDAALQGLIPESLRDIPGVKEIPQASSNERIHQLAEILRAHPERETKAEINQGVKALEKAHALSMKWTASTRPEEVDKEILAALPKFIYFTKYGSLESAVKLDRYVEDRNNGGLSKQERERNRAIGALFKFTGIDPDDLRRKGASDNANDKDLRQIKLVSGASKLTKEFNNWWKQHETSYRFQFTLDGEYFRIWVEDKRNTAPIELENRSAGLQWFLGFFVTFLVESEDAHRNAILLLDEPGVTLHPTAQNDLIQFFKSLGELNQILYTTHSPFLIDNQNIENVVAAYLTEKGETKITRDLGEAGKKTTKKNSVYPVHAALGLSVANTFLADAKPIFVEGPSDQLLLSGMLAALRRLKVFPINEPFFVPFGGVTSLAPMVRLLAATGEKMFPVLLDADEAGRKMAADLKNGMYQNNKDQVTLVSVASPKKEAELEDLVPLAIFNDALERYFSIHRDGTPYQPLAADTLSYVDHVESQDAGDWKVEAAKNIKSRLKQGAVVNNATAATWRKLFEAVGVQFAVAAEQKT